MYNFGKPKAGKKARVPAWLAGTEGLGTGAGLGAPPPKYSPEGRTTVSRRPKYPAWLETIVGYRPGAGAGSSGEVFKKKRQEARIRKVAAKEASLPHAK